MGIVVSVPSGDFSLFNLIELIIINIPFVSVPSGDFSLFNQFEPNPYYKKDQFPSPLGISLYSIRVTCKCIALSRNFSFRPLWGFLFIQCFCFVSLQQSILCFRPLWGFLFIQFRSNKDIKYDERWFPSPLGISLYSISLEFGRKLVMLLSFRPLWGFLFIQSCPL